MTHAKRLAADQRLTATEWAAVLARGLRANFTPRDRPTEIARLAERLSEMADARRGDAAMLEAVAAELEVLASGEHPVVAYAGCASDRVCVHGQPWGGHCPHCDGPNRRVSADETRE